MTIPAFCEYWRKIRLPFGLTSHPERQGVIEAQAGITTLQRVDTGFRRYDEYGAGMTGIAPV